MDAHERYIRALNRLGNEKNWLKGNLQDGEGGYCIMGALWVEIPGNKCVNASNFHNSINQRLLDIIGLDDVFPDKNWNTVALWNNHVATYEEIINVLQEAAAQTAPEPEHVELNAQLPELIEA